MNKYLLLLFFYISLPDLLLTHILEDAYEQKDCKCELDGEMMKTIQVMTIYEFSDRCSIFISNSTEDSTADDFNIFIEIKRDMDPCETGIEYVDPYDPQIKSLAYGGAVVCSFRIYPNIMEKFEKCKGHNFLGRYWKIIHEYSYVSYEFETNLFYMNTAKWWRETEWTHLSLRASTYWISKYSDVTFYSV